MASDELARKLQRRLTIGAAEEEAAETRAAVGVTAGTEGPPSQGPPSLPSPSQGPPSLPSPSQGPPSQGLRRASAPAGAELQGSWRPRAEGTEGTGAILGGSSHGNRDLGERVELPPAERGPRIIAGERGGTRVPELLSRAQRREVERVFRLHNSRKDGYMDLMDLKCMMEKLGAPQTHLGLKEMIAEVDEDFDGRLSFREFLLIFHKAAAGELQEESGLLALARLSEIDVSAEGVKGAKNFFEAKVQAMAETSRFEAEIRAEQEEKRRQAGEQQQRRAAFRQLQSAFAN
ncbi:EF-hand domain-containing protein D1-like isoform X1 [Lethenteron reissneri]|uniref:EF-hand domain-containing protein D1-like isoform X1 n=2 Tax=Lethenteron reissneri TaxID=7753 RepID=UPI002AB67F31|nr:EF-hand domain-containing protein D1-like isoform X1 [Lethenteron reissneri]